MNSIILMGGYRIDVREGKYPDGSPCFVASHPDLPGCVTYAKSEPEAIEALGEARGAYLANRVLHGESMPQAVAATSTGSAHWQMTVTPVFQNVTISPIRGASPALQTA
jgi:predicted RNase H-like HicB family nuclease